MKKIWTAAFAVVVLTACNTNTNEASTTSTTDTLSNGTTATTTTTYTAANGDVTYREKKIMVYTNGNWVPADNDVKLDNDVVVYRDGRVVRNGEEVHMEEGVVVTRKGDFFDKAGNAMRDAWDATKKGAAAVGNTLKNAANEVGDKFKDSSDKKKDH